MGLIMSMNVNIAQSILEKLKDHSAPIIKYDANELTGQAFFAKVESRQTYFCQRLSKLTKCLVFTGRGLDYWVDLLALMAGGHIAIPIPYSIENLTLQTIISIANPDAQVGCPERLLSEVTNLTDIETMSVSSQEPKVFATQAATTAAIIFTSGSTGRPKGAELSHQSLLGNCQATTAVLELKPTDRLFMSTPFQFVSAISHFLVSLNSLACFVCDETKRMQADLVGRIKEEKANCFGGAPLQLRWLCEAIEEGGLHLDWVMSSGDHLNPDIIARLKKINPHININVVYGMTELGGRFCILPNAKIDGLEHTVGKPLIGFHVRVVDEENQTLTANEIGEVQVSGDFVLKSYFNDPENSAASFVGEWFRTGDVGRFNEQGYLEILGRRDDVFKVAGQKVSAVLISDVLQSLDIFQDVFVTVKEHPIIGNVPVAMYTRKGSEPAPKKGAIISKMVGLLPQNHIPFEFIEVADIPRTGSGKVIRKAIVEICA
ncbi:MAG: class I adenylate-forming enzyme family protein [Bdellovibrionota bacterium]